MDGHKIHLTLQLSDFCSQHGIILYCLYPNATHLLQPADVSVFKPLKSLWKSHVREWQTQNLGKSLTRVHFATILDKAVRQIGRLTISNGFLACGLFPLNPDAIDYTKCVSRVTESSLDEIQTTHANTTQSVQNLQGTPA